MEAFPTNNLGGNEYFNAGTTQNYTTNRGLLRFDPSSVIGSHAIVTSASLTLEVVGNPAESGPASTFFLHRMLRDWGEGNKAGHPPQQSGLGKAATTNEATWLHRFTSTSNTWSAKGGLADIDYASQPSADTFIYGVNFSPYVFDSTSNLVADVRYWLAHPDQNFGWMLRTSIETNNFSARRFASREDSSRAPLLTVDYFAPQLDPVRFENGELVLSFIAEADYQYTLERNEYCRPWGWQTLTNFPPASISTNWIVHEPSHLSNCFYRLLVK